MQSVAVNYPVALSLVATLCRDLDVGYPVRQVHVHIDQCHWVPWANAARNNRCFHCTRNNSCLTGRENSGKREEAKAEMIPWEIVFEGGKWIEVDEYMSS